MCIRLVAPCKCCAVSKPELPGMQEQKFFEIILDYDKINEIKLSQCNLTKQEKVTDQRLTEKDNLSVGNVSNPTAGEVFVLFWGVSGLGTARVS